MLKPVLPDSPGKANALARCAQTTDIRWTPLRDVKCRASRKNPDQKVFPAGVEVVGLPYASPEPTDKFICENLTIETFLTTVANPDSALYTKDLGGHSKSWTYFGIVCNGVVRHSLNIRRRYSTKRFMDIPGMRFIAPAGHYRAEDIHLCDVLRAFGAGRNHVALITGIFLDDTGTVQEIEVSEGVAPSCLRATYPVDQYFEKFCLFDLLRYDYIDDVPPAEPIVFPEAKRIYVDNGDCSNYFSGEDVVITVLDEGPQKVRLTRDGTVVQDLEITGRVSLQLETGDYCATHLATGDTASFCVCHPIIDYSVKEGILSVHATSTDPGSRVLCLDFREKGRENSVIPDPIPEGYVWYDPRASALAKLEELTEEEQSSGVFTRPIHHEARHFKVVYENRYGIWTHTKLPLFKQ